MHHPYLNEILRAENRIRPFIRQTYLDHSPTFSQKLNADVYFKLENLQHTGSFKLRGAMNKILSLPAAQREEGVVTASTGNHGAAAAYSLATVGGRGIVFAPQHAADAKLANIKQWGAGAVEIRQHGLDGAITEAYARSYANDNGQIYISPYSDPQIIGGQGTIGVELGRQIDQLDTVFVALGGGGLISGIALYLKSIWPDVNIVACSPQNSQVMAESVKAGQILELESLPTLSDGTAGGVEDGALTFPICQTFIDQFVSVTEDEIAASLREYIHAHHMVIEGAAAVAIAAATKVKESIRNQKVGIVLCGANIGMAQLASIIA